MDKTVLPQSQAQRRRRHIRKRNQTAVLGGVVLCFALIGIGICLFSVIKFGVKTISEFASPKETSSYYETYLNYVVGLDPQPYNGIKNANADWMLKTAAWAAVSDDKNGSYGITADSRITVPATDITKNYEKYFGDSAEPNFHTFTDNGITFEYNKALKCFYIPKNAIIYVFTPKVTDIKKSGDIVTLTVQYLPRSFRTTNDNGASAAPTPSKTMIYTLNGKNGNYVITSIRNMAASPSQASSTVSAVSASSSTSSK